jgi:hypothetical protein
LVLLLLLLLFLGHMDCLLLLEGQRAFYCTYASGCYAILASRGCYTYNLATTNSGILAGELVFDLMHARK